MSRLLALSTAIAISSTFNLLCPNPLNTAELLKAKMVREGYAVVYDRYIYDCPNSRTDLINAQNQARSNRRVFWSQPNTCMPWDFRRGNCE